MLMDNATTADVQAELQEYLNSKNINNSGVPPQEKPDNPIGFIVEYLQKKYPEQAGAARKAGDIASVRGGERKVSNDGPEYSDTDDSEEDDDVGEMSEMAPVAARSRRVSVSAESVDPNKMKQDIKVIEKSPGETARIMEIDTGTVDVYLDEDGTETKKHSLTQGDSFGELAIMYNAPRAATCKADTDCKLWALDRVSFKVIVMHTTINKRNLHKSFLQKVPLLETLTEYEVLTIADALQEETIQEGDVVCEQGQPGNNFYIIKEGTAVCYQTDARGNRQERAKLGTGSYFGEIALIEDKPRQATIVAAEQLRVLTLDRKTFKRVMGPLEDILKRNMDHYNRMVASAV
eukprot:CAMPEP_0117812866 /NCGR_PEP_ID=MMETSP0948-20121206/23106_1 /TAXON_ID=44440 /ORGANISM="Chattonella subsalsa, Strain CCMP2191" /LENGTH=347 /DNA_ID=CAMNT_0005649989 /DNA_START=101 /DNA_END=1146 /DNA_ORIENTATION=+